MINMRKLKERNKHPIKINLRITLNETIINIESHSKLNPSNLKYVKSYNRITIVLIKRFLKILTL